jgi:hypothetical protein
MRVTFTAVGTASRATINDPPWGTVQGGAGAMSEQRVRKTAAEREREGKLVAAAGLLIAVLAYALGVGVGAVVLGVLVVGVGAAMWVAGMARSGD